MPKPLQLYVCWSKTVADTKLFLRLQTHLAALKPDVEVEPRSCYDREIDIVLFAISPDFLGERDRLGEVNEILSVHSERPKSLWVVPLMLRSVDLERMPPAARSLRALPHNGVPVAEWPSQDRAFADVVKGVREIVMAIQLRQTTQNAPYASPSTGQSRVFIMAHRAERAMVKQMLVHLQPYQDSGRFRVWHSNLLIPGESQQIEEEELARANVVLVLISADLMASASHMRNLDIAVKRQRQFSTVIIPILARPVAHLPRQLSNRLGVFKDEKAIAQWKNPDEAWSLVIRELIDAILPSGMLPADMRDLPSWAALGNLEQLRDELKDELSEPDRVVPGPLAMVSAAALAMHGDDPGKNVSTAVWRLRNPEDISTRQLAIDIFYLRWMAALQPVVKLQISDLSVRTEDLRTLLPDLFEQLLRSLLLAGEGPANRSPRFELPSLSSRESDFLRLSFQVVSTVSASSNISFQEHLSLTFQLAQWCMYTVGNNYEKLDRSAVLQALPKMAPQHLPPEEAAKDLLYPFRFAPRRFDYRLASILYSLGPADVDPLPNTVLEEGLPPLLCVTSAAFEDVLVKLASSPMTSDDYEIKRRHLGSCLGWEPEEPTTVPELALWCLLGVNSSRFAALSNESRRAWIGGLAPLSESQPRIAMRLWAPVLRAAGEVANRLSLEEKALLTSNAMSFVSLRGRPNFFPESFERFHVRIDYSARFALIHLFGSGDTDLLPFLQHLFTEPLSESSNLELASFYFSALAHAVPPLLAPELLRLLDQAHSSSITAYQIVGALARTINSGMPVARLKARELLRSVADSSPYSDSPQIRDLARRLLGS